jgi:hypothetical protein
MSENAPGTETSPAMNHAFRVAIVILVFVGIFAAGTATGVLVTARVARRNIERLERQQRDDRQLQEQREQDDRVERARDQQKLMGQIAMLREQVQKAEQSQRGPAGQGPLGPQLMQRFINQIQPTPEQRAKIRPMVLQAAEELRRMRRDSAENTEHVLEGLQDRIAAVLTPEQQERFRQMIQRSRNAFRRYNMEQMRRQAEQRREEQGVPLPSTPAP